MHAISWSGCSATAAARSNFGLGDIPAFVAQVTPVAENPEPIEAELQRSVVMRQCRAPIAPRTMQCLGGQIVPLATVRIVAKLSLRSSDDRSVLAGEEQTPRLGLEIIPRALENARRVFGEAWILPPQHVAAPPVPHGCDPTAELV